MAIWVCRTGSYGQFENLFFSNRCIILTREGFDYNLSSASKEEIEKTIYSTSGISAKQSVRNIWSQIDIFINRMKPGDLVIIPRKKSRYISVAVIEGDYVFDGMAEFPLNHRREINLIKRDIDTSTFPQDIIYSLGAFRTIFSIRQEERLLRELAKAGVNFNEI